MICLRQWMMQYRLLLDTIIDYITFAPGYYIYTRSLLLPTPSKLEEAETIFQVHCKDITTRLILQIYIGEKLDNFLSNNVKLYKLKSHLFSSSKRKLSRDQ